MVWGSLAEWVAALGTTGSLFAAIFLIRSDRRERLVARVDRVQVRIEPADDLKHADATSWELRIRNGTDLVAQDFTTFLLLQADTRGEHPLQDVQLKTVGLSFETPELPGSRTFRWALPEIETGAPRYEDAFVMARCRFRGRTWLYVRGHAPRLLTRWNGRRLNQEFDEYAKRAESADVYRRLEWRDRTCEAHPVDD